MRCKDTGSTLQVVVPDVGIGDVYVVAGQSNAEGFGENKQTYQSIAGETENYPTVFDEFDRWKIGNDDTDRQGGLGSVWPIVGGYIAKEAEVPVAFITTAKGSRDLVDTYPDWLDPERNNFTAQNCFRINSQEEDPGQPNCYQNMITQAEESQVNLVRAILWFQGEEDVQNEVSASEYTQALRTFSREARADLPGNPKLIAGVIGPAGPKDQDNVYLDNVRVGTTNAWQDNFILSGPQAYDIHIQNDGAGDDLHFFTDDELHTLGYRWWKSLESHIYSTAGASDIDLKGIVTLAQNKRLIGLNFKNLDANTGRTLAKGALDKDLFLVREVGPDSIRRLPIAEVIARDLDVVIVLDEEIGDYRDIRVSYALGNYAQEADTIRLVQQLNDAGEPDFAGPAGIAELPAVPFRNKAVDLELGTTVSSTDAGSNATTQALTPFELGEVARPLYIRVDNNTFVDGDILQFMEFSGLPGNLTVFTEKVEDSLLKLSFVGEDSDYQDVPDIENLSVTFTPGAFEDAKVFDTFEDTVVSDLTLDFAPFSAVDSGAGENQNDNGSDGDAGDGSNQDGSSQAENGDQTAADNQADNQDNQTPTTEQSGAGEEGNQEQTAGDLGALIRTGGQGVVLIILGLCMFTLAGGYILGRSTAHGKK